MTVAAVGGENELAFVLTRDRFQNHYRRQSERPRRFSGLTISKPQASVFEVRLTPFEAGNLVSPTACECPKPHDIERLGISTLSFQIAKGLSQSLHFLQRQITFLLIVRFADCRCFARIACDDFTPLSKTEYGRQITNDLSASSKK